MFVASLSTFVGFNVLLWVYGWADVFIYFSVTSCMGSSLGGKGYI